MHSLKDNKDKKGGNMTEELLTTGELARRLKVHPMTVFRWSSTGVIPSLKVLNTRRFIYQDVIAAIKNRREGEE